jgi:hypothetical protein
LAKPRLGEGERIGAQGSGGRRRPREAEPIQLLLEHALDVTLIVDADGVVRHTSPSRAATHGAAPCIALGRSLFDRALAVHVWLPDRAGERTGTFGQAAARWAR